IPEQLLQREPSVGAAFADTAVGDDVAVGGDPLGLVQSLELIRALEGAVIVRGLDPRDVRCSRDVPGHLGLLLWEMVRRELLAPVLLGRTDVDEAGRRPDLRDHFVAQSADLRTLVTQQHVIGWRVARYVLNQLAALQLPLLPAA